MENIKLFINNQKDKINLEINEIKESISKNEYQIKEIENMIINLKKNIDTTYEVFSPYAMDKDSNISEIEKLNFNKNELKTEIEGLNTKLNDCLKSKVIIDEVYGEFNDLEKRLADSVNVTKQLVSDQGSRVTQKCNIETLKYLNYDNEKNNNYLKNIILKRLDSTLNKQSLI